MAARMVNLKELWDRIFPKDNPFFEKDGKQWVRYDKIEIDLPMNRKDGVTVRFCYDRQPLFFLNIDHAHPGDTINLIDIQGISEVKICEC
jgi:hypothetical protein